MPRTEQSAETAVDSAEVAWLVSKRAAAIRARDAEYLASRYAPGALTFGAAPPLSAFAGEAHRVEWLRAWFDRFRGRIEHRVLELTVSVGDDLAFCHSRDVLSVRPCTVGVARCGSRRRSGWRASAACGSWNRSEWP